MNPCSNSLYYSPVLYTSPYVVATPQGYTKHYFVESERIASRIGEENFPDIDSYATTVLNLYHKKVKVNATAPDSIVPNKFAFLRTLPSNWSAHHTTYWQHGDHLGSASWVTDTNGVGYQHLQYMPWGEQWIDQRKTGYTYNTRYTFSGKERDEETGFSYFGARHYNSALSIWLSVDPMADKYPNMSPYTYCANNPLRLVDMDGRDIWELDESGKIVNHFEDKSVDQFHIVDSKGNCIAESEAYRAGTFRVMSNEHGKTIFNVIGTGDNDLCSSFEFFADNMNIEWESITTSSGKMFLGTRQCTDHSNIFCDVESLNEIITVHSHNHPSGNTLPSGMRDRTSGDIGFVTKRPNMKSYIYTRDAGYQEYDKNTYPPSILLEGVKIVPNN